MRKLDESRRERDREAQEYVRWIKKGQKERTIRRYAENYVHLPPYCDSASPTNLVITLPKPTILADGNHRCGLPLDCCRHRRPATRYLMVFGEVVGICHAASRVFLKLFRENDGDQQYRRLLSTDNIETAKRLAERWLGDGDDRR
jgi:hypothetical protein